MEVKDLKMNAAKKTKLMFGLTMQVGEKERQMALQYA